MRTRQEQDATAPQGGTGAGMTKGERRNRFRQAVFDRDGGRCVICLADGQDAHHIMERRLFADGGYELDNGATLCGACHLLAEQTLITPSTIRGAAGIARVVLPPHLYEDDEHDKWGNIIPPDGRQLDEALMKEIS